MCRLACLLLGLLSGAATLAEELEPGFNLIALPGEVPAAAQTCFQLLQFIGGDAVVDSVSRVDAAGQSVESCSFVGGVPAGNNFALDPADGYILRARQATVVNLSGADFACPTIDLTAGVNLVGVPSPRSGESCFSLLDTLGDGSVATIERHNRALNRFEACAFAAGSPQGADFPIIAGEGYLLHLNLALAGVNLNDTADVVRCPPPDRDQDGLSDDDEALYGTDPDDPDSDDDGTLDGLEVLAGTDPLDPQSRLPPDPMEVAAVLDATVATDLADSTEFLISGADPVQRDVVVGVLRDAGRSVVRGRINQRSGEPLPGVQVSVRDQPGLGFTLSRGDGAFDLVVNGGKAVMLDFERSGYLTVQRDVEASWDEYVMLPDIVLVPLDTAVTTIASSASTFQIAQANPVVDANGARQATMLVPPGVSAELVLEDGSRIPASSLDVRATEYTVGDDPGSVMPAPLPPTSGLTYAVELSADEALAAGATDVVFDSPLYFYVENFLGIPTGTAVPMGFLDSESRRWVPSIDGRVVEVVGFSADLAELDVDGDGAADDAAALAALDISDAERRQIALLYAADQSLWRVPVTHFTPWDPNFPYSPPDDAAEPRTRAPSEDETQAPDENQCSAENFSFVDLHDQALGETVEIVGTGLELTYSSARVRGRGGAFSTEIALSEDTVPASLEEIRLEVRVAGRVFASSFAPLPNQTELFVWDGLDAYDRPVQGEQLATIRIGYVYPAVYQEPADSAQSFGQTSGVPLAGVDARQEAVIWQEQVTTLGLFDARAAGLGGWALDVHHAFNPRTLTLSLGNGTRRAARTLNRVITTVTDFTTPFPGEITGPEGEVYLVDQDLHVVVRIDQDGTQTVIAGTGSAGFSNDGGPAQAAELNTPTDVVVDADGVLYIADFGNARIRRVDLDGIIQTVAGGGTPADGLGDDGPGELALLREPGSIALAPDGTLYIADEDDARVRRLSTNGVINTVAGTGTGGFTGDGGPAVDAEIGIVEDIALGPDGSLYLADAPAHRLRRVGVDGVINTVAGTGTAGYSGDGGDASVAQLNGPEGVGVGRDGTIYLADTGNAALRQIDTQGNIQTIAGTGFPGTSGDGGPAALAQLQVPVGVGVGPDGSIYITDELDDDLRRISPQLPGFAGGEIVIPSVNANEVYVFDERGKHQRTVRAVNGAVLYEFRYDANGLLIEVEDGDGNLTTITRDAGGTPTAILSPWNQQTALVLDGDGFLQQVTNPAGDTHAFTYAPGGLLRTVTDPNLNLSTYDYDAAGRLVSSLDPDGAEQTFSRLELVNGHRVTRVTEEGRVLEYEIQRLAAGATQLINRFPDGLATVTVIDTDGVETMTYPNGVTTRFEFGPDPRFGMQAPVTVRSLLMTNGGVSVERLTSRTVQLTDPANPFSVEQITDTMLLNGQQYVAQTDVLSGTFQSILPSGRQLTLGEDTLGRMTSLQLDGIEPVSYSYDLRGRLVGITQGSGAEQRLTTFDYQANGPELTDITDAELATLAFGNFDAAGRATTVTLADGEIVGLSYDREGQVTAVTPPGRPAHDLAYTSFGELASYTAPPLTATPPQRQLVYNGDQQLDEINFEDGTGIDLVYDSVSGRLAGMLAPGADVSLTYYPTGHPSQGEIATIDYASETQLAYTYDGTLPVSTTWSGAVTGSYERAFSNTLRVASDNVNSSSVISYGYDADDLLAQAGALVLRRDELPAAPKNGLQTGTDLGFVTTDRTYNPFGELVTFEARFDDGVANNVLYSFALERDRNGRIVQKIESAGATNTTVDYGYDPVGALENVSIDGVPAPAYQYDGNSNRLVFTAGNDPDFEYDAQDKLLRYRNTTYTYDDNGTLATATQGADTTVYTYDAYGNLTSVTLADGRLIEYAIDGENRRVAKRVDGQIIRQWLYQDGRNVVAELDAAGQIVSRFVYATFPNVPDYMERGGETFRIISDQIGSPRLVVNVATGMVMQEMTYDEFGVVTSDSSPGFQPFGFAGGLYDPLTRLVRFGARDYDPSIGRWTARDPALFTAVRGNLYVYGENDPVNKVDLSGRESYRIEVGSNGEVNLVPTNASERINVGRLNDADSGSPLEKHLCRGSRAGCIQAAEELVALENAACEDPGTSAAGTKYGESGNWGNRHSNGVRDFFGNAWKKMLDAVGAGDNSWNASERNNTSNAVIGVRG